MKLSELKNIIRQTLLEADERTPRCCGNGHCDVGCKGKPCKKGQLYCPKSDYPEGLNEQQISNTELLSDFALWTNQNAPIDWRCKPDIRSWLISIFNLPPFSSTNPNQPCQFIQNKIDQLQNWINSFSGNPNSIQLASKQCKLQVFQSMLPWAQQQFNC